MTVLKDKSLIAFEFSQDGQSLVSEKTYLQNDLKRLRDICVSPDGKIYLATNGDAWRNNNPFTHTIVELSNESYVSLAEVKLQDVQVGPNPLQAGESLHIQLPRAHKAVFTLVDVSGKEVLTTSLNGDSDFKPSLNPGIYLWSITLESGHQKDGKLVVR